MYYYATFDDIVTTHSALETDEYSMPCVRVHFERPNNQNGFDFADGRIPHFNFQKAFGFSEDELFKLRFQQAINQLDNPMRISAVKKDIARVLTVLRENELSGKDA